MDDIYKTGIDCIRNLSIQDWLYDSDVARESLLTALSEILGILDLINMMEEKEKENC